MFFEVELVIRGTKKVSNKTMLTLWIRLNAGNAKF